jgi:hypothetical protein
MNSLKPISAANGKLKKLRKFYKFSLQTQNLIQNKLEKYIEVDKYIRLINLIFGGLKVYKNLKIKLKNTRRRHQIDFIFQESKTLRGGKKLFI